MALINCPECGNEVSDTAEKCPKCGYKIKKNQQVNKIKEIINLKKKSLVIIIVLLLIIAGIFSFLKLRDSATPFDKIHYGDTREEVYNTLGEPDEHLLDTVDIYENRYFKGLIGELSISFDSETDTVRSVSWDFEIEDETVFSDYKEINDIMNYYFEKYGTAERNERADYYYYRFLKGGLDVVTVWFRFDEEYRPESIEVQLDHSF